MPVRGIGVDVVKVERLVESLGRFGERMEKRLFTEGELEYCRRHKNPHPHLAARFAAKEACAKALGTGVRQGVFWRDMGVVNLPSGRPTLELTGGAALVLARLTPEGHEVRIDLSITDDFPTAQAIVIISAVRVPRRD